METFLTLLQYISLTSPSPYTFWVVHKAAIAEIQIMNVSFKQQHVSITVKRLNCSWIIPAHIFSHFHKKYSDNDFCFFNHPQKVLVLLKTADCTSSFTWVWGVKGDFYAHLPLYDSDINRSVIFLAYLTNLLFWDMISHLARVVLVSIQVLSIWGFCIRNSLW